MNEYFYYDCNNGVVETPEERANKLKRMRGLFSRVFLALFIYTMISQFLPVGLYVAASYLMPAEKYAEIANNYTVSVILSSVVQYVIAFPALILSLIGVKTVEGKEKSKLEVKELLLLALIAQLLMYVGNLVGTFLNGIFGSFIGKTPENGVETLITELPIYITVLLAVIIAPIVEELIFRKILIDRLGVYGDRLAIFFSAVAFGLMHANLYQFFYASLLGLLLGYVYTRTRDVKYTVLIHMLINFMGSALVLPVEKAFTEFYSAYELASNGMPFDPIALLTSGIIVLVYSNLQYGMIVGGGFALWHYYKQKKLTASNDKEIYLPDGEIIRGGIVNVGSILFLTVSLILTVLNLFV